MKKGLRGFIGKTHKRGTLVPKRFINEGDVRAEIA